MLSNIRFLIPIISLSTIPLLFQGCYQAETTNPTKILFVAGKKSHGYNSHEHNAGSQLLAKCLNESGLNIQALVHYTKDEKNWQFNPATIEGVSAVIMYCDGQSNHVILEHVSTIDALTEQGVGVGCLHYAVEPQHGHTEDAFLRWIGGYFKLGKSVNPHWVPHFKTLPNHPVAKGVEPFHIQDEWYFNMKFRENMKGVTPILTAIPRQGVIAEKDHHHNSTAEAREAVKRGDPQHVMWVSENENGSRGFGFTGGHFHDNWQDDNFRKIVLNAITWIAQKEIPANGVPSSTPTDEQLKENQDYPEDLSRVRPNRYSEYKRK